MPFIDWSDEKFSVKVTEFDNQHKKLIKIINDLHDAMKERKANTVLGKLIDELLDYTKYHFKTEEDYFAKFGYENTPAHKLLHRKFEKEIANFKDDFEQNKLFLSSKILNYLKDWLSSHIQVEDRKYSEFFNQNGIK